MTDRAAISVVLVSFDSAAVLRQCLRSVFESCCPGDEVIVVDNASSDGTIALLRDEFPTVRVIANHTNRGFGAAANQGVRAANRRLTLLLNPDTRVTGNALDHLARTLSDHDDRAIVGPRLLNEDGTVQRSAFLFPTPRVLLLEQLNLARRARSLAPDLAGSETGSPEVQWLKGACLLAPTELLRAFGPFDEQFFMFSEDVDLCYRLGQENIPVIYAADASITHVGGVSTRQNPRSMTLEFATSTYRFYRKHYSATQLAFASAALRSTALAKALRSALMAIAARAAAKPTDAAVHGSAMVTFLRVAALRPPASARQPESPIVLVTEPPVRPPTEAHGPEPAQATPAAQGSFALLMSFAIVALLNYLFAILMSWLLPVEQYGVLGVSQAVLLLGSTIMLAGFPWALAQLTARLPDPRDRASAFRGALVGNIGLGLLVALGVAGAAGLGVLRPAAVYAPVLVAASATIAVLAVNAVLMSTLQGLLRLRALATVRTLEVVVKVLFGSLFVVAGLYAGGAMLGFLTGAIASTVVAAAMLRRLPLRGGKGWGDRRIFEAAGPIFIAIFGLALVSQNDILTLKAFAPESRSEYLAGQYQVAVTLSRIPFFAVVAVFGAVFPYVARHHGRGDLAAIYARLALKYTFLFIAPVSLVLTTVPDPMIRLLFSDKYDLSAQPLSVAAAAGLILTLGYATVVLLQARGQLSFPAAVLIVATAVQVVIAAIAVPSIGMIGAALGLGGAATVILVCLAPFAIRSYQLTPSTMDVLRYGVSLAAMVLVLFLLPHGSRLETLMTLAVSGVIYLVVLVLVGLLTSRDVDVLGGAFGSRGRPLRLRIGRLVDSFYGIPWGRRP